MSTYEILAVVATAYLIIGFLWCVGQEDETDNLDALIEGATWPIWAYRRFCKMLKERP